MAEIISMPKLGFDMAEGTLVRWVKKEGDKVEKGELLAEIETDKATVEVESQYSGVVLKHLVAEGTSVPVSQPIAAVGEAGETVDVAAIGGSAPAEEPPAPAPSTPAAEPAAAAPAPAQTGALAPAPETPADSNGQLPGGVRASPLARRIAEERGVNLQAVRGSGPQGRIIKRDVEGAQPGGAGLPALQFTQLGPAPADKRIPLSRLRSAIGRRMVQSRQQVPHFYVTHEYDMGPIMDARAQANRALEGSGEKLSVNDFIVKAAALALRQFPNLNAKLDDDAVVQFGQVNIGVAVAVENGLLVIVCRDADRKPLRQISQEVREMAGRVRSGKVSPEDIEGSTFSLSNLGMFDVYDFTAIINPPEAAILALGSAQEQAVVKNGQITVGWRMRATISVDHRVSDGAEAAQYMQALATYIENPVALLL
ncbi:MAG: 2-oxo acid dehydrogenase subunit E2 [Anaerolineales bacterium]|nr:2-oxo acid dehydrogenase subunit E2 [Anaerolineales bacterium]MCW5855754.1 2-oxo acid dehydrogenase subunit E2 [Anaerolineales bacterium]